MDHLVGLDLATPRVVAAIVEDGRVSLRLTGKEPLPDEVLCADGMHGEVIPLPGEEEEESPAEPAWSWTDDAAEVEALASRVLAWAREALALGPGATRAVLSLPGGAPDVAKDGMVRAAWAAGFKVERTVDPALAQVASVEPRAREGLVLSLSLGDGHTDLALVDGPELTARHARHAVSAYADPLVEDVTSFVAASIDHRTRTTLCASLSIRALLAEAVLAALADAQPGKALLVRATFLPPWATVTDGVIEVPGDGFAMACDGVAQRVEAMVSTALREAALTSSHVSAAMVSAPEHLHRLVLSDAQRRWSMPVVALDRGAAARGAATMNGVAAGVISASRREPGPTVRSLSNPQGVRAVSMPPPDDGVSAPSALPPRPPPARPRESVSPSERPTAQVGVRVASIPRAGVFHRPRSVAALTAEPVGHAAAVGEMPASPLLPVLLNQLGFRVKFDATLHLEREGESVAVPIFGGAPALGTVERQRALRAFEWPEGRFRVEEGRPSEKLLSQRMPMMALVVAGLRPVIRELPEVDVVAALASRMGLAPMLRADRQARLARMELLAMEQRAAEHAFDPHEPLVHVLDTASLSRGTLARLVFLLDLFEVLEWRPPVLREGRSAEVDLRRRVGKMAELNHFEVLSAHWSQSREEIAKAWEDFQREFGPEGRWASVSASLCAEAMTRGAEAWRVLSDDRARVAYRREAYPTIDLAMLEPVVEQQAKMLAMKGEAHDAQAAAKLAREIHSTAPVPRASAPPRKPDE
ncbi:MAG: hypothetical protein R3A52_25945 [Polyangiales bacterium]